MADACLAEAPPPPPLPRIEDVDCADVYCLDVDGGLALEGYLRASQRWMREAWAKCGPEGIVTPWAGGRPP